MLVIALIVLWIIVTIVNVSLLYKLRVTDLVDWLWATTPLFNLYILYTSFKKIK